MWVESVVAGLGLVRQEGFEQHPGCDRPTQCLSSQVSQQTGEEERGGENRQ